LYRLGKIVGTSILTQDLFVIMYDICHACWRGLCWCIYNCWKCYSGHAIHAAKFMQTLSSVYFITFWGAMPAFEFRKLIHFKWIVNCTHQLTTVIAYIGKPSPRPTTSWPMHSWPMQPSKTCNKRNFDTPNGNRAFPPGAALFRRHPNHRPSKCRQPNCRNKNGDITYWHTQAGPNYCWLSPDLCEGAVRWSQMQFQTFCRHFDGQ
jgi:hypothetical protein